MKWRFADKAENRAKSVFSSRGIDTPYLPRREKAREMAFHPLRTPEAACEVVVAAAYTICPSISRSYREGTFDVVAKNVSAWIWLSMNLHTTATNIPDSACLKANAICSSVKPFPFHGTSPLPRTENTRKFAFILDHDTWSRPPTRRAIMK